MTWNSRTRQFEKDWPIEPLDVDTSPEVDGAARGLVIGLIIGVAIWTVLILSIRFDAIRTLVLGVLKVLAVVGVFGLVLAASHRITDRWRTRHPDNPVVGWLDRAGL